MTHTNEVLKLALEVLESERDKYLDWGDEDGAPEDVYEAITAIEQALAQPAFVQEPWGYGRMSWGEKMFLPTLPSVRDGGWMALYTTPPTAQRQWFGLTDEDKLDIEMMGGKSDVMLAEMVEAKLKERNA